MTTDREDGSGAGKRGAHGRDPEREARLAERLRANLKRRKAQTRSRGEEPAPPIKNRLSRDIEDPTDRD